MPVRRPVENRLCEAARVSREHELHQRRLQDIAAGRRNTPLVQGGPATLLVAGARGTRAGGKGGGLLPSHHDYPHLSRRHTGAQTAAALQERLRDRVHSEAMQRIRAKPGVVATQQHRQQPRGEYGRFGTTAMLQTASERQRKQKASELAQQNESFRHRVQSAPPRFASASTIRALQDRPPPNSRAPKPAAFSSLQEDDEESTEL